MSLGFIQISIVETAAMEVMAAGNQNSAAQTSASSWLRTCRDPWHSTRLHPARLNRPLTWRTLAVPASSSRLYRMRCRPTYRSRNLAQRRSLKDANC